MKYINTNGVVCNANGVPLRSGSAGRKRFGSTVSLSAPKAKASEIYKTTAAISYTKPAGTNSFVVERATLSDYSDATQIYAGTQQVVDETTLTENTQYYYRVKGIGTGVESSWTNLPVKTFYSPMAVDVGGNRVATSADVADPILNPDGHINVGDYLYVGANGSGGLCPSGNCFPWGHTIFLQKPPALGAGNKICIIGGRGYDYIQLDMSNNPGTVGSPVIITNIGGQVRGTLRLTNCVNVKVTGKYDPVAKTGSSDYLGYDATNWDSLYGSFGFFLQGIWSDESTNLISLGGDCNNLSLEYIQSGQSGFASFVDKNDSLYLTDMAITSTGNVNTYSTTTQAISLPTSPTWTPERIRLTLNTVTTANIDYIQFVGTGSTTGTFMFQAESFDGGNHATNNSTYVTLTTTSTSDAAYIDIPLSGLVPAGTYNFSVVAGCTTNITLVNHIAAIPMDGIDIGYCYFADTGGEGIYSGSTQAAPTQGIKNVNIHHSIYARNGGNNNQLGNITGYTSVKNCVLIGGGFQWSDEFQKFQDYALQWSPRKATVDFQNNLVLGSNGVFMNYILNALAYDITSTADTTNITNNAFLNCRTSNAGYFGSRTFSQGTVNVSNNYWGRFKTTGSYYDLYYPSSPADDFVLLVATTGGTMTFNANNNIYDNTTPAGSSFAKQQFTTDTGLTLSQSGNVQQASVPYPQFNNYWDQPDDFDYANVEKWTAVYSADWNATNRSGTQFEVAATNQGVSIDLAVIQRKYQIGEMVRHNGRFYKSLIADNYNNAPIGQTDTNWELIVFSNGSLYPIDDVRLLSTDTYALLGMGLGVTV